MDLKLRGSVKLDLFDYLTQSANSQIAFVEPPNIVEINRVLTALHETYRNKKEQNKTKK